MQNLVVGVLGGAHLVFECLGVLDAIMTTSYEKKSTLLKDLYVKPKPPGKFVRRKIPLGQLLEN